MATKPPEEFKIVLEPLHEEYSPGSEVRGTLFVKVDSNRQYGRIVINLVGKGYVHWTRTAVHGNDATSTAVFKTEKLYVDQTTSLWNKREAAEGSLPAGTHSFPFQFVLPKEAPSSHESEGTLSDMDKGVGWTRYTLQGRIKQENRDSDHLTEAPLTVKEKISIDDPKLHLPVHKHTSKTTGIFSCASGSVSLMLTLPETGFYVNEEIPYRVTVDNGSSRSVEATVSLEEHITYHTRDQQCHPIVIFHGSVDTGPVKPGDDTVLTPQVKVLKIPTSVILTRSSSLIKQSFLLKVKAQIPHMIRNPSLTCPLSIGSSPKVTSVSSQQEARLTQASRLQSNQTLSSSNGSIPPPEFNPAPPEFKSSPSPSNSIPAPLEPNSSRSKSSSATPKSTPAPSTNPATPKSNPATPESTPAPPESNPATPKSNSATPESTPAPPESNPATPKSYPATPESTPAPPESNPATPKSNPATPESTPAPPESNSATPKSNPATPESTPGPAPPESNPATPESNLATPKSNSAPLESVLSPLDSNSKINSDFHSYGDASSVKE